MATPVDATQAIQNLTQPVGINDITRLLIPDFPQMLALKGMANAPTPDVDFGNRINHAVNQNFYAPVRPEQGIQMIPGGYMPSSTGQGELSGGYRWTRGD